MLVSVLALAVSTISAIAACWATVAARKAAVETRRAVQAQIVASLLDAYSSDAMLEAIAHVKAWVPGSPIHLNSALDRARRRLSHHFGKIVKLANAGLLDPEFLPVVIKKTQAELFCNVVQPLDEVVNPNCDRTAFVRIGRLYSGHPPTSPLPDRSLVPVENPDQAV